PNSPLSVMRRFLPPEEGGIDKSQPRRQVLAEAEVVRWDALPYVLASRFPEKTELGRRLRGAFEKLFVSFMLDAKPAREPERQGARKSGARNEPQEDGQKAGQNLAP